jgi:hypothetical protein
MRGNGMAATVGRLRECSLLDWKFTVLSHNTIRGGAGAAVLNGEFLARWASWIVQAPPVRCPYERGSQAVASRAWLCPHEAGGDEVWRHFGRGCEGDPAHRQDCARTAGPKGLSPVVVVSAMAKVTDQLLAAAKAAGRGDQAGALAISSRLRNRHMRHGGGAASGSSLLRTAEAGSGRVRFAGRSAAGIAAVGELTPRTSDMVVSFRRAPLQPDGGRAFRRWEEWRARRRADLHRDRRPAWQSGPAGG